jgi:hypothetical protein
LVETLLDINLIGGPIPQRFVNPLHVLEEEVFLQAPAGIRNHRVLVKINLFIFDRSPETFHKNIVIHATLAIHTDFDVFFLQPLDEIGTGKLGTLIGIENFRSGEFQGLFQGADAESSIRMYVISYRRTRPDPDGQ